MIYCSYNYSDETPLTIRYVILESVNRLTICYPSEIEQIYNDCDVVVVGLVVVAAAAAAVVAAAAAVVQCIRSCC